MGRYSYATVTKQAGETMNDQQLIAKLKNCKNGMFVIPLRSDVEKVHDLWDEHVSRRDRRTLSLTVTVCGTGMTAHIGPRIHSASEHKEAAVVALAFVMAIVLLAAFMWAFAGFSPQVSVSDLDARHECIRQLGEECKL